MDNRCTCTPGSPENGWHEQRCQSCEALEFELWRDEVLVVDVYSPTVKRFYVRRGREAQ